MPDTHLDLNAATYYNVNSDFCGTRALNNKQMETVSYCDNSAIRIWYNDLSANFDAHWHNAIEIITPIDNYYDVIINDSLFHVLPGEIIIIPPGDMHSIIAPDSGKRFIFLFNTEHLSGLKGFSSIQALLYKPIHMTRDTHPYIYDNIYDLLVQMRDEYFHKYAYAELSIYALLIHLFVKLGYEHINTQDLFPNVRLYKQREYAKKFNELLDYIDNHYMDDLTLDSIANSTGFSKFHFSRLFRQYTSFTFCDYLNLRRIKAAEKLLTEPDLSITEIALQSGFSSISTFNRIFRQTKNCTPSEYRYKNSQHGHHK